MDTKTCTRCQTTKPVEAFGHNSQSRGGVNPACKACVNSYYRERYTVDSSYDRSQKLRSKFGITIEEYDTLLHAQRGLCAVCGRPERRTNRGNVKRLAVDHDHATGAIRGLLCHDCNCALGFIEDDPTRLEAIMRYLDSARHP